MEESSIAVKVWSWTFSSVQVWSGNSTPFHNVACTCQDSLFNLSLLTYLLTPWSTVLEKLTSSQLVKKFPAFYGNWKFITAFTSAHQLYLPWARSIWSLPPPPSPFLKIHLNIILPSMPGSSKKVFPSGFPTNTLCAPLLSSPPYVLHALPISFFLTWSPE